MGGGRKNWVGMRGEEEVGMYVGRVKWVSI